MLVKSCLHSRYHHRTAVVVSALQVAKYPLATPGPYGTFTPPPARHFIPAAAALAAFHSSGQQQQVTSSITGQQQQVTSYSKLQQQVTASSSQHASYSINTASTVHMSPYKVMSQQPITSSSAAGTGLRRASSPTGPAPPPVTGITSVSAIPVSAAPLSFNSNNFISNSRPTTPERIGQSQSRGSYERVRGTHLLERIGSVGDQSMLTGTSFGSPRLSMRGSSPHTSRSTSEVTRSIISSPRPTHSPRPSPHSPKIKLRQAGR